MHEQPARKHLAAPAPSPQSFWGDEEPAPVGSPDPTGLLGALEKAVWSILAAGEFEQRAAHVAAPAGRQVDHDALAEFDDL